MHFSDAVPCSIQVSFTSIREFYPCSIPLSLKNLLSLQYYPTDGTLDLTQSNPAPLEV